jgi:hypothetical protein
MSLEKTSLTDSIRLKDIKPVYLDFYGYMNKNSFAER